MELWTADGRLFARNGHETICIEPWGRDVLRVRATVAATLADADFALVPPQPATPDIAIEQGGATIRNGLLTAKLHPWGSISFVRSDTGQLLCKEWFNGRARPFRRYRPIEGDAYQLELKLEPQDERFFGLGQHPHGSRDGLLDQRGCVIDLRHCNNEISIPFYVSSRQYGFLWNNPSLGRVELGVNGVRWVAQSARQFDYVVFAGTSYADIMARYADATGHPPMLPQWASGFWQSKLRYVTQDELLNVAREYKRRGLPLSVIVIDYFHWDNQGDWSFATKHWPDPAAMTSELDDMGVKVMVSVWPCLNVNSRNYATMERAGYLIRDDRGLTVHGFTSEQGSNRREPTVFYDASNQLARRFVWERVREGYYRHGIKVFWLDGCEPDLPVADYETLCFQAGSGTALANLYPWWHAQAFHDGLRSEGEQEVLTLGRSAWAGSQRFGAAVWSGDIISTFFSLRQQVAAGLNMAMSGIPWWTTDIGGFFKGNIEDPAFHELLVRWFQYGTFCPLMRLHGQRDPKQGDSGAPNEIWSYGEDVYRILKKYLLVREAIRPYVMEQMRLCHQTGVPPMRPLFFDFPDDADAYDIKDQFLLGPDLCVAPVVHEGARSRQVYLPAGRSWIDAWSGQKHQGGQTVCVEAPLEVLPLFIREGSSQTLPPRFPS